MITPEVKKKVGTFLCILFAVDFLDYVTTITYWYAINLWLGWELDLSFETRILIFTLKSILFGAALVAMFIYGGLNKTMFTNLSGRIAAFVLAAIGFFYLISNIVTIFNTGFSIYEITIPLNILSAIMLFLFYFTIKTWSPTKICAIISIIPSILGTATYVIYYYFEDFTSGKDLFLGISNISFVIEYAIIFIALILTIVWLCIGNRKTMPSPCSEP